LNLYIGIVDIIIVDRKIYLTKFQKRQENLSPSLQMHDMAAPGHQSQVVFEILGLSVELQKWRWHR